MNRNILIHDICQESIWQIEFIIHIIEKPNVIFNIRIWTLITI